MPVHEAARAGEFLRALRTRLPEAKVRHCISVAEHLLAFAAGLGLDREKSVAAGLLHDYSRALPGAEMLRRAEAYGIPVSPLQRARPRLLHGMVGAEEIRRELGIADPDVHEAVYWHTTGTPGLGRLGQALFVADFSEPGRAYPEAAATRDILESEGFDAALCHAAAVKLGFHDAKGVADPESMAFARWVRETYGV